jgi:peptidoglycan/xylan/chitin deacetylase (PgdA/CDA1 family)
VAYVITGLLNSTTPFWWDEVDEFLSAGARLPGLSQNPVTALCELKAMPNSERLERLRQLRDGRESHTTRQLSTDDLLRLRDGRMAIGNHTRTHPRLDRCTALEVAEEIRTSHMALTDLLGSPPTTFAYPHGNWDPRVEQLLVGLGYQSAMLFDHRFADRTTPPLRISRVRVESTTDLDRFELLISGLHPWLRRLRGRS